MKNSSRHFIFQQCVYSLVGVFFFVSTMTRMGNTECRGILMNTARKEGFEEERGFLANHFSFLNSIQ